MNTQERKYDIVLIGVSAGGMKVLPEILSGIKDNFILPIVIISHQAPSEDNHFVSILSQHCKNTVKEADEKEVISDRFIYTAPPNYHLLIEEDKTFCLSIDMKINYARPSIDVTFCSGADVYGSKLIAIILTGANNDGANGASYIKRKGGLIIVQDPQTAYMPIMPESAIESCEVDFILTPEKIVNKLNELAYEN